MKPTNDHQRSGTINSSNGVRKHFKITTLSLLGVILAVVFLLTLNKDNVYAVPSPPHKVYGKITHLVDGTETVLGSGYTIQSRITRTGLQSHYGEGVNSVSGNSSTSATTHASTTSNGRIYNFGSLSTSNYRVCADDPDTSNAKEGGLANELIYFYVNNVLAKITSNNGTAVDTFAIPFETGGVNDLTLRIWNTSTSAFDNIDSAPASPSAAANDNACTTKSADLLVVEDSGGGGGGGGLPAPTATPQVIIVMMAATVTLTATEVEGLTAAEAAEAFKDSTTDAIAETLSEVTDSKAAAILDILSDDKAAAVVGTFEDAKAATIVEALTTSKASAVIEKITEEKAVAIIEVVTAAKSAAILEDVSDDRVVAIISTITEAKAISITELLSDSKGAATIENLTIAKATVITEGITSSKAGAILSIVSPQVVGQIFDAVTTDTVTNIIVEMAEDKLLSRMPEMTAEKMFAIDPAILFNSMPNAPTEQLVAETAPQVPADLPAPSAVQSSNAPGGESIYLVQKTKSGHWAGLVGSPKPIDAILGKFASDLQDVSVVVTNLTGVPSGISAIPGDDKVSDYFDVEISNVVDGDVIGAHTTFYMDKSWVTINEIHKWSVELKRFDNQLKVWVPFSSKRLRETANRIYYSAVLPGFSTIAVTGNTNLSDKKFEVSELKIRPLIPTEGQQVTITAKVSNLTSANQVYPANLWLDGTIENSKLLSLNANGSGTVTFNLDKPVGKYDVRVEQLLGSFSIGDAPTPTKVPVVAVATAVPPTATPKPAVATAIPPTATPQTAPTAEPPTAVPPAATPKPAVATAIPPTAVPPVSTPKPVATSVPIITAPDPTSTPVNTPTPVPSPEVTEEEGSNMGLIIAIVVIAIIAIGGGIGFMVFRNKN